jgi:transposase
MPRAYSDDLRIRLVEASAKGSTCRAIAARFGVGVSTVVRVLARHRATGSCSPGKMGGSRRHALEPHGDLVDRLLAETCDITLDELGMVLAAEGITVGRMSIHRYLAWRGYTRKKRPRTPPSRSARTLPPQGNSGETTSQG